MRLDCQTPEITNIVETICLLSKLVHDKLKFCYLTFASKQDYYDRKNVTVQYLHSCEKNTN